MQTELVLTLVVTVNRSCNGKKPKGMREREKGKIKKSADLFYLIPRVIRPRPHHEVCSLGDGRVMAVFLIFFFPKRTISSV